MTALDDPRTAPGDDLDPTLAAHLNAAAGHLTPPPADLPAVMARGKARQGRSRLLAGATAVALVAGGTTAVVAISGGRTETPLVTAGETPNEAPLQWRRADPSAALGYASGLSGTDGRFALSTAPGLATSPGPVPRVLYRSDDGVSWSPAATLGDDLNLADLARAGDRLYAVGTGPATAATASRQAAPDLVVAWSDDGGRSFQRAPLPVDLGAIAAKATNVSVSGLKVAAGAGKVVAVTTLNAEIDVAKVLPRGVSAADGWAPATGGIDLLGPPPASACPAGTSDAPPGKPAPATTSPPQGSGAAGNHGSQRVQPTYCFATDAFEAKASEAKAGEASSGIRRLGGREGIVPIVRTPQEVRGVVRHLTWAELGVSGDLLRAVTSQPVSYVADEGSTSFTRVEVPSRDTPPGEPQLTALSGGPAGVRLVLSGYPGMSGTSTTPQAMRFADGQWTAAAGPPGLWEPMALGTVRGRTAVVGRIQPGTVVLAVEDGSGGWTTTELPAAPAGGDQQHPMASAGIGPLGVVAVVGTRDGTSASGTVYLSRDGTSLERWSLADLAGATPSGVTSVVVGEEQVQVGVLLGKVDDRGPQPQAVLVGSTKA